MSSFSNKVMLSILKGATPPWEDKSIEWSGMPLIIEFSHVT